jgi:riboflavin biosynthesis pyrimidine reductase
MKRPYIICHMLASLDGRIDCAMTDQICGNEYYEALEELNCPSMINGRVTAEMHYADKGTFTPKSQAPVGKESVYCAKKSGSYHIITDTLGSLLWKTDNLDGKALVCLVSEYATQDYLAYLKEKGISYIATGRPGINLMRAMEILKDSFGVDRLVLTGGGNLNGSFLASGLLDEISMMYAPGIDGRAGWTAAFDGIQDQSRPPVKLKLTGTVKQYDNGTIWIRYLPA